MYRVTENGWEPVQILEGMVNPSYLCPDRQGKTLYAVHGDFCQVSACRIAGDGSLTYLNTVGTHGTNPVHLSLDRTGKWLFVANLQTGGVAVIPGAGGWLPGPDQGIGIYFR